MLDFLRPLGHDSAGADLDKGPAVIGEGQAGGAAIAAHGPVAAFMARGRADPAAPARLAAPVAVPGFVAAAVAAAAGYGIALAPSEIDDRLRPDPLGLSRFAAAPVTLDHWPAAGWMPTRSAPNTSPPAIDWAWFGDAPLAEPLYEDSVRRATALPFNRMFRTRTALADLIGDAANHDVRAPSGFVFHLSRCGSTLAGRMLRAVPGHAVASEPEPLDAVLQWAMLSGAPHEEQVAALRAVVAALGRDRIPGQRRFFVKTDAWHVFALPLFRAAFPDVPWVFLYRDPVEVIVSHLAEPGLHFVPGMLPPALVGLDTADWTGQADYGARVLAQIRRAVIGQWPLGGGLLGQYPDIADAMTTGIPLHFGFNPTADERAAMIAATAVNAKRPNAPFAADSAAKQEAASADVVAAAAAHAAPHIASLDILRRDAIPMLRYS